MRKVVSWVVGCTLSLGLQAQPATVYDPELNLRIAAHRVQQGERTVRYRPDGNDLVIYNGKANSHCTCPGWVVIYRSVSAMGHKRFHLMPCRRSKAGTDRAPACTPCVIRSWAPVN